jgi:undecaprenyl-diphosphatase
MLIEALKALVLGIVEGVTEWLPISSTGHMILVDEFLKLNVSEQFLALFLVVIQLGAILAVVILYFHKLNPFSRTKTPVERRGTWRLWGMVAIGCIPAAVIGMIFDDWVHDHLYNGVVVASMLIIYGVVFIIMEHHNRQLLKSSMAVMGGRHGGLHPVIDADQNVPSRGRHARPSVQATRPTHHAASMQEVAPANSMMTVASHAANPSAVASDEALTVKEEAERSLFRINSVDEIDPKAALKIGLFQVLAIIPGTSRSGATIIGGMLSGCSRVASAEFTFFLAIPIMLGWGLVKTAKFIMNGLVMSSTEIVVLIVGVVSAFVVSVLSIKFLMGYIKKNDFTVFGWYRIILGIVVLGYFGGKFIGLF